MEKIGSYRSPNTHTHAHAHVHTHTHTHTCTCTLWSQEACASEECRLRLPVGRCREYQCLEGGCEQRLAPQKGSNYRIAQGRYQAVSSEVLHYNSFEAGGRWAPGYARAPSAFIRPLLSLNADVPATLTGAGDTVASRPHAVCMEFTL